MNKDLITLAMPVYNVEKYVERGLLSALNQTYDNLEILVIDDKGSDKSMDVVKRVVENHPNGYKVRIVDHITNRGTGGTRNTAIQEARGCYLYLMDSDDEITPDAISILYRKIKENPVDMVVASIKTMRGSATIETEILPDTTMQGPLAICRWMDVTKLIFEVPTWNKLYDINFLRKNKITCIPHHRNEDTVFSFKLMLVATRVATISDMLYVYYLNESSTVHQKCNDFYFNQYLEILEERIKTLKESDVCHDKTVYFYLVQPFFDSFIERVLTSDLSNEKKTYFFSKLKNLLSLGYNEKDLSCRKYRDIYKRIQKPTYTDLLKYYKKQKYVNYLYNLLSKYLHIKINPIVHP